MITLPLITVYQIKKRYISLASRAARKTTSFQSDYFLFHLN